MDIVLEAEISPQMNTASTVRLAQLVEEADFSRLGISNVVYWPTHSWSKLSALRPRTASPWGPW